MLKPNKKNITSIYFIIFFRIMSMIFHLIECLNQLGFKIKIESIVGAHEKIDHSFLLSGVDLDKVLKDKNYVSKLKEDLYKKYFERRYEMVNCKVDSFLCFIWEQVGIEIFADSLYPFRNAMIKEFLSEQNLIYDEVIEQFCKYLNIARENQSHISLFYIKLMMLPSMFLRIRKSHRKGDS